MILTAAFLLRLTLSHSQHSYLRWQERRQRSKMRTSGGKSLKLSASNREEQLNTQEGMVDLSSSREKEPKVAVEGLKSLLNKCPTPAERL